MVSYWPLIVVFVVYGIWGSPTPDSPGLVEAILGILIILSIKPKGFLGAISHKNNQDSAFKCAQVLLLYGFIISLTLSLMQANNIVLIARDLIGFLFMLLPIFYYAQLSDHSERNQPFFQKIFFRGALFIGIVFSLRVLIPHFYLWGSGEELLYLANSPLVLFSAIILIGLFLEREQFFTSQKLLKGLAFLVMAFVIIAAILQDVQRAMVFAIGFSAFFLFLALLFKSPKQLLIPVVIAVPVIIFFSAQANDILESLIQKTTQVGLNMRYQEWQAVWDVVSQNPLTFLFGLGWGAEFESPAVGQLNVSFTHSLLSYMLLKTGFLGLMITFVYCSLMGLKVFDIFIRNRVVGIALLWSFLIPIFLYASYKSLDFGLLLVLILAFSYNKNKKIEPLGTQ